MSFGCMLLCLALLFGRHTPLSSSGVSSPSLHPSRSSHSLLAPHSLVCFSSLISCLFVTSGDMKKTRARVVAQLVEQKEAVIRREKEEKEKEAQWQAQKREKLKAKQKLKKQRQ